MTVIPKILLPVVLFCTLAGMAQAEVTVTPQVLQKGAYSPPKCDGKQACLCEADIEYPALSGMRDAARQAAINDQFKQAARQLACQGPQSSVKPDGDDFSVSHHYEITFQSPHLLALRLTDRIYEGGTHGNGTVEGVIIDLDNGKALTAGDIFGARNIASVNDVIYNALAPKADGVFHDEVESRKGSFIKDGTCQGCTLVLDKGGVQVVFQTYEVAPFADGNPAVPIPAQDIAYPLLAQALSTGNAAH